MSAYDLHSPNKRERTTARQPRSFSYPLPPKRTFNKVMIRLFTALCKSMFDGLSDEEIYQDSIDTYQSGRFYGDKCPRCGAAGSLAPYGSYTRGLVSYGDGKSIDSRIIVIRYKCGSCNATHALLPDILIPHASYTLRFKLSVLLAYFQRGGATVEEICARFGIAVSTLYDWKKCLLCHQQLLLGIVTALKATGQDFLHGLLNSQGCAGGCPDDCLCVFLRGFFQRFAFSFMQNHLLLTACSVPP